MKRKIAALAALAVAALTGCSTSAASDEVFVHKGPSTPTARCCWGAWRELNPRQPESQTGG